MKKVKKYESDPRKYTHPPNAFLCFSWKGQSLESALCSQILIYHQNHHHHHDLHSAVLGSPGGGISLASLGVAKDCVVANVSA